MSYQLLWEIPGIWEKLEELESLKETFLQESRNFHGKTEKIIQEFVQEYIGLKSTAALSYRDMNRFIYLLLLGKNYGQYRQKFWEKLNQGEREKFFSSFKKVLKMARFFLPEEDISGNRMVNLVLIHLLIPKNSAKKFVETATYIHKKLNGDKEKLLSLEQDDLETLIYQVPSNKRIISFAYACEFDETFVHLKKALKEAFFLIDGEVEISNFPDWLENEFFNYNAKIKQETREKNLVRLMKNEKFVFLNWNKKRIRSTEDRNNRILYLCEEPVYLLVKDEYYEEIIEDLEGRDVVEEDDYGNSKLLRIESSIEDLEIDNLEIIVEKFEKLVEIEGKEINFLVPLDRGKIFSEGFSVIPSPLIKELKVETPGGQTFTLEDLRKFSSYFSMPGRYVISYRDKRKVSQVIYLLPESPKVVRGLKISYKGKVYKPGEIIEEYFGKFKVSHETIAEILKKKKKIFNETSEEITLPKFPNGFKTYLFNKCGEKLYSFSKNEKLSLRDNLPAYLIVYPLSLTFYYDGTPVNTISLGKNIRKKKCPLQRVLELLMNKKSIPLKFKEEFLPRDSEFKKNELNEIFNFLPSSLREGGSLSSTFIKYIIFIIKNIENRRNRKFYLQKLYQIRSNPYLRRIANQYLRYLFLQEED